MGEYLASHGYIVAAATYPLTHYGAPGGAKPEDVINQSGDISFILDNLLAKTAKQENDYSKRIDPQRIAAVGMSLGGMTSEMVAYHPLTGDPRISAAVSIAGPAYMFSREFFSHRNIPFMMIASPQDALINYQENAANILDKIDGATLVSIDRGSHIGFSGGSKWLRWMDNPDSLGCRTLVTDEESISSESGWYNKIGGPEIGVLPSEEPTMCADDPLPQAMNPLRQLELTKLAVSSFLSCHFSSDDQDKLASCEFLNATFAQEIAEVSVRF